MVIREDRVRGWMEIVRASYGESRGLTKGWGGGGGGVNGIPKYSAPSRLTMDKTTQSCRFIVSSFRFCVMHFMHMYGI